MNNTGYQKLVNLIYRVQINNNLNVEQKVDADVQQVLEQQQVHKKVIFTNYVLFTNCKCAKDITQKDIMQNT